MEDDIGWFDRSALGGALRWLRNFYREKDALLLTQTFIILFFHAFVLFALMIGRSEPSLEPPLDAVGRDVVLRADDPLWGVAHGLVLGLSISGFILRRSKTLALAFTLSSVVWLFWGILIAAWTSMTPDFAITLSGMILLVVFPMSAVIAWVWTEREREE